jgi:hypothetical protein
MMSSTVWACQVLSPAALHLVIGTVAHGADAGLQSPCSPELLNHSAL